MTSTGVISRKRANEHPGRWTPNSQKTCFVKRSRKDSKGARAGQGWDVPSDHSRGSCLKRESKVSEGKTFKRKSTGQKIGLSGRSSTILIPTQELYSNSSSSHSRANQEEGLDGWDSYSSSHVWASGFFQSDSVSLLSLHLSPSPPQATHPSDEINSRSLERLLWRTSKYTKEHWKLQNLS